jgi:hypothetical protein
LKVVDEKIMETLQDLRSRHRQLLSE